VTVVELALGIGITLNLVLTEVIGLGSAGLVVPGYLALYLNQPARLLATWLVAGRQRRSSATASAGSSCSTAAAGSA